MHAALAYYLANREAVDRRAMEDDIRAERRRIRLEMGRLVPLESAERAKEMSGRGSTSITTVTVALSSA